MKKASKATALFLFGASAPQIHAHINLLDSLLSLLVDLECFSFILTLDLNLCFVSLHSIFHKTDNKCEVIERAAVNWDNILIGRVREDVYKYSYVKWCSFAVFCE